MDPGDEKYDPDSMLHSVRKVVRRIGFPDLRIDGEEAKRQIIERFSREDEVRDKEVDRLKRALWEAMEILDAEISRQIRNHADRGGAALQEQANRLIDDILEEIREETRITTEELKDRQGNLRKYSEIKSLVNELSLALG